MKVSNKSGDDENGTFDFLGFTHYMGRCRDGIKRIKRKTSKKRYHRSIKRCKEWLKYNRTLPVKELMRKLNRKLIGTYNYYAVSDNGKSITSLYHEVLRLVYKWLNRRSQKKSFNGDKFKLFLEKYPVVKPKVKVNLYKLGTGASYIK